MVTHRCNLDFIPHHLKQKTLNLTQVGVFPEAPVFIATDPGSGPETIRRTSPAVFNSALEHTVVHQEKPLLPFSLLLLL